MIPQRKFGRDLKFGSEAYRQWFWANVDRSGGPDACWEWQGSKQGPERMYYGNAWREDHYDKAHRVAWELERGPIPEGQIVMHMVCDMGWCVNPSHLELGTNRLNMLLARLKGRLGKNRPGLRKPPPSQLLLIVPDSVAQE